MASDKKSSLDEAALPVTTEAPITAVVVFHPTSGLQHEVSPAKARELAVFYNAAITRDG